MLTSLKRSVNVLGVFLLACTTSNALRGDHRVVEEVAWERTCEDDQCLSFLCGEDTCAFYPCGEPSVGEVVLTRGVGGVAPPGGSGAAVRWWGNSNVLPENQEPVFVIPWRNHDRRPLLPSEQQALAQAEERARRPHEKHHIFPQEKGLKEWFEIKGIDIHEATLLIDKDVHERIHRGPKGGPWNEAWREYRDAHRGATKEEIWRHAGELIFRFELFGPVVPYYRQL